MSYILALDQGTTSSRAIVFNEQCQVCAIAQQEVPLYTPQAGFVEQDANQIWNSQIATAQEAISKAGLLATDISSIGIANQRETTIVWYKKTGQPIAPAIVWQDRRTHAWCNALAQQGLAEKIQHITGLKLDPYFSASKIVWLLDNVAGARQQAENGELAFGTVDSWLMWQLTRGEHVIDVSNASRTLLMDLNTGQWSDELLSLFNIPQAMLPTIVPSGAALGKTAAGLLGKQIPLQAILGDQQAALFGQGCFEAGMAKNTYGTGCFMLMNTGGSLQLSQHQLLTTVAWQTQTTGQPQPLQYALEGSVFMAGAIVQWLRDNLGFINHSSEVEQLACSVQDSDGVVLVPAFTGLGAPHWQPNATASLTGLTRGTTKAHIARAALESIAFQVSDVLTAMQQDAPVPLAELRVDGGAAQNDTLMQFQADILGVPVLRPKLLEITALGVAQLAGLQAGVFNQHDLNQFWQLDEAFEPCMSHDQRQSKLAHWQQQVQHTLAAV